MFPITRILPILPIGIHTLELFGDSAFSDVLHVDAMRHFGYAEMATRKRSGASLVPRFPHGGPIVLSRPTGIGLRNRC
jgi:hypothetical protein